MEVSKTEFKAKALQLLRIVEETGGTLLVSDRGKPTIEVRPFRGEIRDTHEMLKASVMTYEAPCEPVEVGWEARD